MIEAPGFSLLHCVTALHKYQLGLLWSGGVKHMSASE